MATRGSSRVCPTCGRVLDERLWEVCPRCREPVPAAGEELPPPGMLTNWGLGMCALIAGSMVGLALAASLESPWPLESRVVLWPTGLGALAAGFAAVVGPRLIRPARRSFERLLIALMVGAFLACTVTLVLWRNPYGLTAEVVIVTLALYMHLRHKPADWGLEDYRGGPTNPTGGEAE